jgi:uncharacterized RDD family membrane protein YckC
MMKCKRCRATVADEADSCPYCGQDLASLRQLLKDFYREEPTPPVDQNKKVREPEVFPVGGAEEPSPPAEEARDDIRIVTGPHPAYDGRYPLQDPLTEEEPEEGGKEPTGWDRALRGGFWLRSLAMAVDSLILLLLLAIFVVLGFLTLALGSTGGREVPFLRQAFIVIPVIFPLGLVLALAYFTFFHGTWGQTIGKMIFGLQVVRTDGQPLTFSRALARAFCYFLSALPFSLGFLWVGLSPAKRGWHDSLTDTMVTREQ